MYGLPVHTDRKENAPMARVHAATTPRFHTGLTDRSLESIVRARTMIMTPTRLFSGPKARENPETKTQMSTKNRDFPASVLASMTCYRVRAYMTGRMRADKDYMRPVHRNLHDSVSARYEGLPPR